MEWKGGGRGRDGGKLKEGDGKKRKKNGRGEKEEWIWKVGIERGMGKKSIREVRGIQEAKGGN